MGIRGRIILLSLLGIAIAGTVIFLYYRSNRLLQSERDQLHTEIRELHTQLKASKDAQMRLAISRDSLGHLLAPYLGYEALLKANMKRDAAYEALPFKYGDAVLILPDSARGMISEVIMGGNPWNYYVRYKVIQKGGKETEIYPSQLAPAKKP